MRRVYTVGTGLFIGSLVATTSATAQNLMLDIESLCRTEVSPRLLKGQLDPNDDKKLADPAEKLLSYNATRALGQVVFVDFDSGTDGTIVYTTTMRNDVIAQLNIIFQDFDITFYKVTPPAGPYSTVTVNAGSPGGVASNLDFRNLSKGDTAVVNVDGLGISGTTNIVSATSNLVAHEFGHLLGLRHGDSYGALGNGITPSVPAGNYLPAYPGPLSATETDDHVIASPGSVGSALADLLTLNSLSERSAIKVQTADTGTVVAEAGGSKSTIGTAQPVSLQPLATPNTLFSGLNSGSDLLDVQQVTILGALAFAGEIDIYEIESDGGLINVEVISGAIGRYANSIDSQIRIYNGAGALIPYHVSTAYNDDELESFDSIIIDLTPPAPGLYYFAVQAFSGTDTGNYELYIHEFNGLIYLCHADYNDDGVVDGSDLGLFLSMWGTPGGDLNDDGLTNGSDLGLFLSNWGPCP